MNRINYALFVVTMVLLASIVALFTPNLQDESRMIIPGTVQVLATLATHHDDKDDKK
ncbi:hypothetical protein NIES2100_38540 [Calothrix sp. NIES-2100]|uniref:hypothetical protein n=1 Tax=Calothrix sp. NIES-2100 TaxID=1954172 RepID=UPI000B5F1268|nr:hypothetical protein NIES2100_38540 [Calothrix sp. NIES-2100]